jgi:hypothetical protein
MAETATVRRATKGELRRLATTFAEAFQDDSVFGWLIPDEHRRPARLRRFFWIEVRHTVFGRGEVWTTEDLSGVATTLPPGKSRVPPHATVMQGSAFGLRVALAARLAATMEWRHSRLARGPHHYLRDIGVTPSAQGARPWDRTDAAVPRRMRSRRPTRLHRGKQRTEQGPL